MTNAYRVEQLIIMLEAEQDTNRGMTGVYVEHWRGKAKRIRIDAGAIRALLDYYKEQGNGARMYEVIKNGKRTGLEFETEDEAWAYIDTTHIDGAIYEVWDD